MKYTYLILKIAVMHPLLGLFCLGLLAVIFASQAAIVTIDFLSTRHRRDRKLQGANTSRKQ